MATENLISKKDLLAVTGISYGQLYRWKREKLIPEEWFIKKSSYTGQETFFPREQMISRIQSIVELKDQFSLEELAKTLSSSSGGERIKRERLSEIDEIDEQIKTILVENSYNITQLAYAAGISKLMQEQEITDWMELIEHGIYVVGDGKSLVGTVVEADKKQYIIFSVSPLTMDERMRNVGSISVGELAGQMQLKYRELLKED